jgi:gamma-glutamyltranspeptidase/glutathione hydrolase
MFLRAPAVQGRPASLLGPLAVGVPGTVAGLWALHQAHGARPWAELVAPALGLARGMVVHERLATSLRTFRELLASDPGARAVFLRPDGTPPRVGDPFAQPDLASTLEALARDGAQGFYRGAFAARVDAWMREHGGLLTAADLAGYTPRWREPLRVRYRGWTLVTMAPSSSGGLTLGLLLGVLDARGEAPPWHTADAVHVFAEASRRAFADRNAWLGDPDAVDVPTARLLDPAYLRARARELPPERATAPGGTRPGTVEGTHTTHVSVADGHGGFVAVTTTLNALYGARVLVPGTGVLLNNQMDDFSTRPGEANRYGLVQGPHNEVAPGRRMASSMAPTVALDPSGVVRVVLGSPGGATIPSTVAQVLANIIDHGMDPASAVAAPRLHRQDAPEALYFERGGLDPEALASLRARGHTPEERPGFQGDVQLVALRCDGSLLGLSDPRRGGAPAAPPEDVAVVH